MMIDLITFLQNPWVHGFAVGYNLALVTAVVVDWFARRSARREMGLS